MTAYELEHTYTRGYITSVLRGVESIGGGNRVTWVRFHPKTSLVIGSDSTLYGNFSIWFDEGRIQFNKLEEGFIDPLNPTKYECTLFQIQHGCEYPLLQYLKEAPQ